MSIKFIQSVAITSNTTDLAITGLPQTFDDLVFKCSLRSFNTGSTPIALQIRFNNDSASSYAMQQLRSNGSTGATARITATTSINPDAAIITANAGFPTATFGMIELRVQNYKTTSNKNVYIDVAPPRNAAQMFPGFAVGHYRNTNAITQINFINAQLAPGSEISIYGISKT